MEHDLNNILKQRIERFYRLLIKAYDNRIKLASDKRYAHEQFEDWAKARIAIKEEPGEVYDHVIFNLNEAYRLGKPIKNAIKSLRNTPLLIIPSIKEQPVRKDKSKKEVSLKSLKSLLDPSLLDKYKIEKQEEQSKPVEKPRQEEAQVSKWSKKSDLEFTYLFADYAAKVKFLEYINSQTEKLDSNGKITETMPNGESPSPKNKEFTTARQVVAVHFMLKYMQVKNTDKTEIARFIQFLTGKNYDNIYKRVLNPFNVNDKVFREDLRFVKSYFERLGLRELVKMVSNELDIDA